MALAVNEYILFTANEARWNNDASAGIQFSFNFDCTEIGLLYGSYYIGIVGPFSAK